MYSRDYQSTDSDYYHHKLESTGSNMDSHLDLDSYLDDYSGYGGYGHGDQYYYG